MAKAAEPLSAIDELTVSSTDGASQLTKTVATNVTQGMQLASDLTGVDLTSLFAELAGRATKGAATDVSSEPVVSEPDVG